MGKFEKKIDRQDYFLATGEIVFTVGDNETPNAARCNAVVMSSDGRIASLQLAQTQQMLQAQFFRKIGEIADVKIMDVVILGLIHLGQFTQEEFNKAPEGMAVQEKPTAEQVRDAMSPIAGTPAPDKTKAVAEYEALAALDTGEPVEVTKTH